MEEPLLDYQFCGAVLSYGKVPRLNECIKSLGDLPILLFNPLKSWWDEKMQDYTHLVVDKTAVTIFRKYYLNETEVRNDMIDKAHKLGFRVMIMLDADEVLDDVRGTIEQIKQNPFFGAYTCNLIDYGPQEELLPARDHKPVIAVDTRYNNGIFTDKRCVSATLKSLDVDLHHYSYDVKKEYKFKLNKEDGDIWPPPEHRNVLG